MQLRPRVVRRRGLRACLALTAFTVFPASAERLPFKAYTVADGLARDYVGAIVPDSAGFLWMGTSEGLSRFDGHEFVNYGTSQGLPHRFVSDILETRAGGYWVGTEGGLGRFDPRAALPFSLVPARPSPSDLGVHDLLEDRDGTVWAGTSHGLYRLARDDRGPLLVAEDIGLAKATGEAAPDSINRLLQDRQGALWIAAVGGLVRRQPDGRVERLGPATGVPQGEALDLARDETGFWVSTVNALCHLAERRDAPPRVEGCLEAGGVTPRELLVDRTGVLWVGTDRDLRRLVRGATPGSGSLQLVLRISGAADSRVTALSEDRSGNLWVGTEAAGALKLSRAGFTSYDEGDGLASMRIQALLETRSGALVAATYEPSLNRFDGSRFVPARPNLPAFIRTPSWGWSQFVLEDREGDWWIPTGQGIVRFGPVRSVEELASARPKAVYTKANGLPEDSIFRLFEDARGDIWISVFARGRWVTCWERKQGTFRVYTSADGLPEDEPASAFREDHSGQLWIGFYEGSLCRRRAGRFERVELGRQAGFIKALHVDASGRLWIGTGQAGLLRIDEPAAEHPRVVALGPEQGLSSIDVRCLAEDQWGRIYAGTGRGLDRIDPASGWIRRFTTRDGLASSQTNVALVDRKGALWVGTLRGLSRMVPEPDGPEPAPLVRVTGLRIAGASQRLSSLGETTVPELVAGPGHTRVEIAYVGLSLAAGESLRYQYRLLGAGEAWNPPTTERHVEYPGLLPGSYRFEVRAISARGALSPVPATVELRVLAPVWRRPWFLALAGAALALGIAGLHRGRVRRLLAIERVRTHIAADLHDDIGSGLSHIALLGEVSARVGRGEADATHDLGKIAELARNLAESMGDIVWAINPKRDRSSDLVQRMRRFASDVLTARGIEMRFAAAPHDAERAVGADVRRHVYLVFKEALHNAVRHSGCQSVAIALSFERNDLCLSVRDDGRGFDPEVPAEGHGLANMRRRTAELGGTIELEGAPGQGTSVALRVPLRQR